MQNEIDEHGLQTHVQLIGSMSQKQVLELYPKADIFAVACVVAGDGDRDGIPVVLMEAMAFEIPVVTTPVTGIPDLVSTKKPDCWSRNGTSMDLTAALDKVDHGQAFAASVG